MYITKATTVELAKLKKERWNGKLPSNAQVYVCMWGALSAFLGTEQCCSNTVLCPAALGQQS